MEVVGSRSPPFQRTSRQLRNHRGNGGRSSASSTAKKRPPQAAHLASIVGSTTSGEVTGHRAGTNKPSTVSSRYQPDNQAPAQRGCSRHTDRTPEVTTSGQATPSEEPQASQQKNSGASRHQQVSTSDTASADKKISSQSPGETSSGNITMTPAGSTSTVSIAAKPPTSTNKRQTSHQSSTTSQLRSNCQGGHSDVPSSSGSQSTPAQPIPGG